MKRYIRSATVDLLDESIDIKFRVARDPKARPSMLARLVNGSKLEDFDNTDYFRSYPALMREIAKNPNTPADSLRKLAADPKLYDSFNDVRYILATRDDLPEDIAKTLATCNRQNIRKELAENKTISQDVLRILAKDEFNDVVYQVALNPNIPDDVVEYLLNRKDADSFFAGTILGFLVQNRGVTPDVITRAYDKCPEPWMVCRIAKNPNASPELIRKIAYANPYEAMTYFAHLPQDILKDFAKQEHLQPEVARHPNTPIEILRQFLHSKDYELRCWVARNPVLPESMYEQLANDKSAKVRLALAENRYAPKHILHKLENDPSSRVRDQVRWTLR